jgi:heme oxygenase (mycobilin-producing)
MIVAVSRFRVANGLEDAVQEAFRQRPRLVDSEPGFLGMETFTDMSKPTIFYLVTRWTDAAAFHARHRSDGHHRSHQFIPHGLKLDAQWTKLVVQERIGAREPAAVFEETVVDSTRALYRFLRDTHAVYFLVAAPDGCIRLVNAALARQLGREEITVAGTPIWQYLGATDCAVLRTALDGHAGERVLLNFYDVHGAPFTVECHVDAHRDGFTLVAEPTVSRERRVQDELFRLNNEWAVVARERAQTAARAGRARRGGAAKPREG